MSELEGIESHMKTKEQEKFQLEKELSRLKRAVLKGGATDHPQQGRQQHDGGHHPPKPEHPTPHPQHQNVHDQVQGGKQIFLELSEKKGWMKMTLGTLDTRYANLILSLDFT